VLQFLIMENNIQPPVITPTTPQVPVEATILSNKSNLLVVSLVIIEVITLLVAGYFVYQFTQLKKQLTTQPNPTPVSNSVLPTSSPNMTGLESPIPSGINSWKTYTNTKYFYTFQYPQQYTIKNNNAEGYDNNTATSFSLEVFDSSKEPSLVLAVNVEQPNVDFVTYANTLFTTISTFKFPQSDKDYQNPLGSIEDNSVITPTKKETINGMNAYTFTIKGNFIGSAGLPTKTALTTKYILFNSKGMVYILKLLNPSSDTELLISTFKLTQ
jgi:hypothetical protein